MQPLTHYHFLIDNIDANRYFGVASHSNISYNITNIKITFKE